MEKIFNHEESLSLINEMISQARNNVKMEGTSSLIFWGYLTATLAIINCVLLNTLSKPEQSFWIWGFMLPAAFVSFLMERRMDKKRLVKTHIDKIAATVWFGFLISFVVFTLVLHLAHFKFDIYQIFMINTPVIMVMVGMGEFISACIYRQKIWYAIAALTWTGAVVCSFLTVDIQLLVFAACILLGFVVPGHILNHQAKKSHV
jgi:hypothetical protein